MIIKGPILNIFEYEITSITEKLKNSIITCDRMVHQRDKRLLESSGCQSFDKMKAFAS